MKEGYTLGLEEMNSVGECEGSTVGLTIGDTDGAAKGLPSIQNFMVG